MSAYVGKHRADPCSWPVGQRRVGVVHPNPSDHPGRHATATDIAQYRIRRAFEAVGVFSETGLF